MDISPSQAWNLGGEYPYTMCMTRKEIGQRYRERNREELRVRALAWYHANKSRCREYYENRKNRNPEVFRAKKTEAMRRYRATHPDYKRSVRSEATRIKDRERRERKSDLIKQQRRESMKRAYEANPEKYRTRTKTWRQKNLALDGERQKVYRRKRRHLMRAYYQNRLDTDVNFRIAHRLRSQLRKALKRNQKSGSAIELLGCSIPEFRIYLESLWEEGMVWSNYGNKKDQWNTDHLMPCALFDLTKPEHQKRCFHFSNLRPMWAIPNMSKGKKLITDQFNLL